MLDIQNQLILCWKTMELPSDPHFDMYFFK